MNKKVECVYLADYSGTYAGYTIKNFRKCIIKYDSGFTYFLLYELKNGITNNSTYSIAEIIHNHLKESLRIAI